MAPLIATPVGVALNSKYREREKISRVTIILSLYKLVFFTVRSKFLSFFEMGFTKKILKYYDIITEKLKLFSTKPYKKKITREGDQRNLRRNTSAAVWRSLFFYHESLWIKYLWHYVSSQIRACVYCICFW